MTQRTFVSWHSERAGLDVLTNAVKALRRKKLAPDRLLYLVQQGSRAAHDAIVEGVPLERLDVQLEDPTSHSEIYAAMRASICPRLAGEIHVNVSPGTPAMHAVWLILHAGGALPRGARLWSSQWSHETKRTRLDPVDFELTTYLAEIRRGATAEPEIAAYETEARSPARRAALERLARYARVIGAPLLLLGERGTGKTRLLDTHVKRLKQRDRVQTLACGGLESTLADSLLFGHRKGAFTGADKDREGLIALANGGVLFLDEIQDLPKVAQRKLVRVLQDRHRRFRPLGSDEEQTSSFELVCASNLDSRSLRSKLDADFYDRVSHLTVHIPPLRECREDLADDWPRVWRELRVDASLPEVPPWSDQLKRALDADELAGNLRDLQRLAWLMAAWGPDSPGGVARAIEEWQSRHPEPMPSDEFGNGTREERLGQFRARMARWAKQRWGTWKTAALELDCDEKTLRHDAGNGERPRS